MGGSKGLIDVRLHTYKIIKKERGNHTLFTLSMLSCFEPLAAGFRIILVDKRQRELVG